MRLWISHLVDAAGNRVCDGRPDTPMLLEPGDVARLCEPCTATAAAPPAQHTPTVTALLDAARRLAQQWYDNDNAEGFYYAAAEVVNAIHAHDSGHTTTRPASLPPKEKR